MLGARVKNLSDRFAITVTGGRLRPKIFRGAVAGCPRYIQFMPTHGRRRELLSAFFTDLGVRAVAKGSVVGLLALTQMSCFRFFGGEDQRRKIGAFVGSVTEWLGVGKPACAERILLAFFKLNCLRLGIGDFWFVHRKLLPYKCL